MSLATAPGICIDHVSLALGEHSVFNDFNLTLKGGQWHAVLGRSGIGKSSLIKLLAGIHKADSGSVRATDDQPMNQRLAYMSQDDGLLPWLSVIDNIQLGPKLRGEKRKYFVDASKALLEKTGLAGWESALPFELSGGMRQRVALARTLLEERPVVLMDEPFSRLDAITRDELQNLAFSLLKHKTVVLITHDPVEALRLASCVYILHGGHPTRIESVQLTPSNSPRAMDDPMPVSKLGELWSQLGSNSAIVGYEGHATESGHSAL